MDNLTKLYGGAIPTQVPNYTKREVARHAGVPLATLNSWVKGRTYPTESGKRFFKPIITPPDPQKSSLSFVNLVEAYVLSAIRRQHKIELPKVRKAIDFLGAKFNSKHPLAEHQFATDGIDLFIEQLAEFINVTSHQLSMQELLRLHLKRIDRDPLGNPARLYPLVTTNFYPPISPSQLNQPRYIVIDPLVSFGRSVISKTAIPTALVADRFNAGDSIEDLANDYVLDRLQIEAAIRYEKREWFAV